MAELLTTSVTREELDNGVLPMNHVLCEVIYTSEGMKTKSGIVIGVLTDLTYADPENPNDDSSHIADFSENAMRVYSVPERLYFDPEDEKSMPWETEMELQGDDMVWTDTIECKNAITLECEGKLYKLIPYEFLYVAKRERWIDKWTNKKTTDVIPLNGYILLTELYTEAFSELEIGRKVDKAKGCVEYVGSCNKRYKQPDFVDFQDLREGDTVLFDKKAVPFKLERQLYNSMFSDKELFLVCQRRRINMVINRKS